MCWGRYLEQDGGAGEAIIPEGLFPMNHRILKRPGLEGIFRTLPFCPMQ